MTHPAGQPQASIRDRPPGFLRLIRVRGTPVYIHWSCIAGGVAISAASGFDPGVIPWTILGYILVVAVHEGGHALAARMLGLDVHVIRLKGMGGICFIQMPGRARDAFIVYSAGMVAQLLLFAGALLWPHRSDASLASSSLLFAFIVGNGFVFLSSFLPSSSQDGLQSDGGVLWQLACDRWRGRIYLGTQFPGMKAVGEAPVFPPGTSLLAVESLVPPGFLHGMEVLNDGHTPLEFVIGVFERHLGWSTHDAVTKAIETHNAGGLLVPLPSLAEAERIAMAVAKDAEDAKHAFVCRAVSRNPRHGA